MDCDRRKGGMGPDPVQEVRYGAPKGDPHLEIEFAMLGDHGGFLPALYHARIVGQPRKDILDTGNVEFLLQYTG